MNPTLDKQALRQLLSAIAKAVPPERREMESARARKLLRQQPVWQQTQFVLFYVPMRDELDLFPLVDEALKAGKRVALPGFIAERSEYGAFEIRDPAADCAPGKFGILEPGPHCPPVSINTLDLILVPGVGFDLAGHRLGRGKGYYDRLLAHASGTKCGVAYTEQIPGPIPVEKHDAWMDCILTPDRWIDVNNAHKASRLK